MDKILVNVYVPMLHTSYDIFLPPQLQLSEVTNLVRKAVAELSEGRFMSFQDAVLAHRETGRILDMNRNAAELGVENGTKLMLI